MPLYEYRCKQCGHQFEKIQSFSAPEERECPVCKGEVERLISAPAIQFKGAGWYVTDYAGKGGSKKATASRNASGESSGNASGDSSGKASGGDGKSSSESKPASSSDSGGSGTKAAKSE